MGELDFVATADLIDELQRRFRVTVVLTADRAAATGPAVEVNAHVAGPADGVAALLAWGVEYIEQQIGGGDDAPAPTEG